MSFFRRHPLGSAASGVPPATLGLMIACIGLWFVEVATIGAWKDGLWTHFQLDAPGLLHGKIWQLVTYQVLHSPYSPWHVLFNMLALFSFGRRLEHRWGSFGFVRYFAACGIGGGLAFVAIATILRDSNPVVGASGAVMGILMAWALIWPTEIIIVGLFFRMQVRHLVLIIGLIDVMFAWMGAMGGSATGAVAHVGGALTGWAYLAHAHRLRRLSPGNPFKAARLWWRRRRLSVVNRDFDKWLKDRDDDLRH